MYCIIDTFTRVVCFELGLCFGTFIAPILLHACFGVPYLN